MKDIFLIDLDDTLLDFGRAERENLLSALSSCGIAGEALCERFHEINDGLWKALERGETDRETLKVRRFELLFSEFGIEADAAEAAARYFNGFPAFCYPYEGALSFLKELKARGRVFIVTNGSERIQRAHLSAAGFLPCLDGVFISETMGANKPSRAFCEGVERGIGDFSRERAVWIGDSLTSDGQSAALMGVDFILFARGGSAYGGRKACGYAELLSAVDSL